MGKTLKRSLNDDIETMQVEDLVKSYLEYQPDANGELIKEVWNFAYEAHLNQDPRQDGSAYFTHPVAVAGLLTTCKVDEVCICAGLLHDTVEDTHVTLEDIRKNFGDDIANIVDGVTKLSKIETKNLSQKDYTAGNLRKLVAAIASDLRVLVVKLADRMHNMRTITALSSKKRRRIAIETQDYYVPFARRIGLEKWADTLQELVFEVINPEGYKAIQNALKQHYPEDASKQVELVRQQLEHDMDVCHISAQVTGRMKAPHSIWLKMRARKISFEQLSDVMAFRIVVEHINDCYLALGHLHRKYPIRPGRIKDYISLPRENGYRSIHTVLIGPYKEDIEVQIRTQQMHDQAEYGSASHWYYKEEVNQIKTHNYVEAKRRWFTRFQEVIKYSSNAELVLHHSRLELDQKRIMAFTPQGDLIWLPPHATPIDFAFAVHTELGMAVKAAKINGHKVPLDSEIQRGDRVEIIAGNEPAPDVSWKHFVKTGRALSLLKQFEEKSKKAIYIETGKQILHQLAEELGYVLSDKAIKMSAKALHMQNVNTMLQKIGESSLKPGDALVQAFPGARSKLEKQDNSHIVSALQNRSQMHSPSEPVPIIVDLKTKGMAMHMGECCSPIPGDRIIGTPILGQGYRVHVVGCTQLKKIQHITKHVIRLAWPENTKGMRVARLELNLHNLPGALGEVTTMVGREGSNITNLVFTQRNEGFFKMEMCLEVKNTNHLQDIMRVLSYGDNVQHVKRL